MRHRGNASTELAVLRALRQGKITGWRRHTAHPGRPDFYFPAARLAVFVHGCFWHMCPLCARRMPRARARFWAQKLAANADRDIRVRRKLKARGIRSLVVWEHELPARGWIARLRRALT